MEFMGANFFAHCELLQIVWLESPSSLQRIGGACVAWSGLKEICIPRTVEIVRKPCFSDVIGALNIRFESMSRLKEIKGRCFAGSGLLSICILYRVQIISTDCFNQSIIQLVEFERHSRFRRIENSYFAHSILKSIPVPKKAEILGTHCFLNCQDLEVVSFKPDSCLLVVGDECFRDSSVETIKVPKRLQTVIAKGLTGSTAFKIMSMVCAVQN
jgi:hypothetical protein